MLQLALSVLITVGFAACLALSNMRARGPILISAVGMIIGVYWTVAAWREMKRPRHIGRRRRPRGS